MTPINLNRFAGDNESHVGLSQVTDDDLQRWSLIVTPNTHALTPDL